LGIQPRSDAAAVWIRAIGSNLRAINEASALLVQAGKVDDAITLRLPDAESGDGSAMFAIGKLLRVAGRTSDAVDELRRAAHEGHHEAMSHSR
jgi:hypothetical protein